MLVNPVPTICILVKDYYDIEKIETMKAKISKLLGFRFFISPQYRSEPKYDIYAVFDSPNKVLTTIQCSPLYDDIEDISVNEV